MYGLERHCGGLGDLLLKFISEFFVEYPQIWEDEDVEDIVDNFISKKINLFDDKIYRASSSSFDSYLKTINNLTLRFTIIYKLCVLLS